MSHPSLPRAHADAPPAQPRVRAARGAPSLWRFMSPVLAVGVLASFFMVATVLLLSDRAPLVGSGTKDFVLHVGEGFEAALGVDWIDRNSIPGSFDQIGHAVLWGSGVVLLGLTLRRWMPVAITAIFLAATSIVFEILQGLVTTTRNVDPADVVANGVGIAFGLGIVLLVVVVLDMAVSPVWSWLHRAPGAPAN